VHCIKKNDFRNFETICDETHGLTIQTAPYSFHRIDDFIMCLALGKNTIFLQRLNEGEDGEDATKRL